MSLKEIENRIYELRIIRSKYYECGNIEKAYTINAEINRLRSMKIKQKR